jgi:hypothetical protein
MSYAPKIESRDPAETAQRAMNSVPEENLYRTADQMAMKVKDYARILLSKYYGKPQSEFSSPQLRSPALCAPNNTPDQTPPPHVPTPAIGIKPQTSLADPTLRSHSH